MMQSLTQNFMYILGATLLFIVLSSKNILIYNEELLIALSFVAFVVTCAHTMGTSIAETFETIETNLCDQQQPKIRQKSNFDELQAGRKRAAGAAVLGNALSIVGLMRYLLVLPPGPLPSPSWPQHST